jgi:hypothetical protein
VDRFDLATAPDVPLALAVAPGGGRLAVATARGVVLIYGLTSAPPR